MATAAISVEARSLVLDDEPGWMDVENLDAIRRRMRHLFRPDVNEVRALIRERNGRLFNTGIHKRLRHRGRTEYQARWIIYTALHAEGKA